MARILVSGMIRSISSAATGVPTGSFLFRMPIPMALCQNHFALRCIGGFEAQLPKCLFFKQIPRASWCPIDVCSSSSFTDIKPIELSYFQLMLEAGAVDFKLMSRAGGDLYVAVLCTAISLQSCRCRGYIGIA